MKRVMSMVLLAAGLASAFFTPSVAAAGEVGFVEDFALSADRAAALKQLVPGTDEYYYYNALHLQNTGDFAGVDGILKQWIERRKGRNAMIEEIECRQALLRYDKDPKASLDFITRRLGVQFNHQREVLGAKTNLPTKLDDKAIAYETLLQRALANNSQTVDGLEPAALEALAASKLEGDRRRALLSKLTRPDVPGLVQLVVDDLKYRNSGGFGSLPIHSQMLQSQLDELLKLMPELLKETRFINAYLPKLRPGVGVDWQHDAKERQAYLDRLQGFVSQLVPAHNSLKACVLYHRLVHDAALGVYDKDRFMAYIQLPRSVSYLSKWFNEQEDRRRWMADLNADFLPVTQLPRVASDEALVRNYLQHFFLTEDTYEPYAQWINDLYLKDLFAETKIVNGLGDAEKLASMLDPQRFRALKDRVDIDFALTNKAWFAGEEAVSLDVFVKNVPSLIVKVYQVNTLNFYRAGLKEVDTDINLDGLVANEEVTNDYKDVAPLLRVKRTFEFKGLNKPGTYVIEFIGNGAASRALVRKGRLTHLVHTGSAGQVFTILDEAGKKVDNARLYLGGHEYLADKDGSITVPFSTAPGQQTVVLSAGEVHSLAVFDHQAERYVLDAGFHVERESLLRRKKATLIIRPVLKINGALADLSILQNVKLMMNSVDLDNIASSREVPDFKLSLDKESTCEFQVPERLAQISFVLRAQVRSLSQAKDMDVADSKSFTLNQIDRTEKVDDLFLVRSDAGWAVDMLGKNGEARGGRPGNFEFKHRLFTQSVHASLQTDEQGRVTLGALGDIDWLSATTTDGVSHRWTVPADRCSYLANVNGRVGEAIQIPYMGTAREVTAAEFSLLSTNGGTFIDDYIKSLKLVDGVLVLDKLPEGDYSLLIKSQGTRIDVRVTNGPVVENFAVGAVRRLEIINPRPLQIASVDTAADTIAVKLVNASAITRVHVAAVRFQPEYFIFGDLAIEALEPKMGAVTKLDSAYVVGRNIGDEYRYILDRKYAVKFPGNMLARAGLLLNPWAISKTQTGEQVAARGGLFGAAGAPSPSLSHSLEKMRSAYPQLVLGMSSDLDFLAAPAAVLANLQPDKNGVVTINRKDLGDHQYIQVIAVDPLNTVYRQVALTEAKLQRQDQRLMATALDPAKHLAEQKQITLVDKGQKFVVPDISASGVEAYDSLAKVYTFYSTISNDPTLREFAFIVTWDKLTPEQKREKYSKYACHELNFFLSRKDAEFFAKAVQPYLKNKKDKTFMDRFLVNEDLAGYLQPWEFERLNMAERALLGQRIAEQQAAMARHEKDVYDLLPVDLERFNFLFKTALKAGSLESTVTFAVGDTMQMDGKLVSSDMATFRKNGDGTLLINGSAFKGGGGAGGAGPAPGAPLTSPAADKKETEMLEKKMEQRAAAKQDDLGDRDRLSEAPADAERQAKKISGEAAKRKEARQLYRQVDKTEEWVENNYYHLPIERQDATLITPSAFWRDFAAAPAGKPFLSTNLAEASRNFSEMMFALAVLDLPMASPKSDVEFKDAQMTLTPGGPAVIYHKEIKDAQPAPEKTPILVSQNFFRLSDRYRYENNERFDKYVTEEFLTAVVYGAQVVITNPTSARQRIDLLLQIPKGAMPVMGSQATRGVYMDLQPFSTATFEYYFYFPQAGDFDHFPVHVGKNDKLLAYAEAVKFKVVVEPTKIDRASWDYISQNATDEELLTYLKDNNINRLNLERIAYRMKNAEFFKAAIALLDSRHVYNHTLWSYGLQHNVLPAIRQYLQHADSFVAGCGAYIDSKPLTINPVERRAYQHMEYAPLVNARAHKLGKGRQIVNDRLFQQYGRLMKILTYRPQLDNDDLMAVTYYMLLQDRVEEGLGFFARVDAKKLPTALQYDYFTAYTAFYRQDLKAAGEAAAKYKDYPVDRWQKLFADVQNQIAEAASGAAKVSDKDDRTQGQTQLAATDTSFELTVEARKVTVKYQNLASAQVNYYLMDVELLFSRNPFVQQYGNQFAFIRPNETAVLKDLPKDKSVLTFDLPAKFTNSNVMVEVVAGGQTKAQAYFANSLAVQVIENYGQVKVSHEKTGAAMAKVYVKTYARMKDGSVKFYKDGYTDVRGRFEYTSLNTDELDQVDRFSLLILSETDGAVVREAAPPKR